MSDVPRMALTRPVRDQAPAAGRAGSDCRSAAHVDRSAPRRSTGSSETKRSTAEVDDLGVDAPLEAGPGLAETARAACRSGRSPSG